MVPNKSRVKIKEGVFFTRCQNHRTREKGQEDPGMSDSPRKQITKEK